MKNKDIVKLIKKINDEQLDEIITNDIIEEITNLNPDKINSIFRNSSKLLQNKLWNNDTIQKVLILGNKDTTKVTYNEQLLRSLENLNKVIKSQTIKKQLYHNKYFVIAMSKVEKFPQNFFHSYDLNKIFEGLINSELYKSLDSNIKLRLVEKFNKYTDEILLPEDFRKQFKNIDRILYGSKRDKIPEEIMKQLTKDELFFLDYLSKSIDKNTAIKEYLLDSLINRNKSFEELFAEAEIKDSVIRERIRNHYNKSYFYNPVSLTEKIYHILLNEIEDEEILNKFFLYLSSKIAENTTISPELIKNKIERNYYAKLLDYKSICNLKYNYDLGEKELRIIFYLKFNIALANARYLHGISKDQLTKLNVKHINKIVKFLEDKTQDELSAIYGNAIKMYFIFGYERTLEILNKKYGDFNKVFLDNIGKTDVTRVEMRQEGNKFLPVIDKRFINFMFEKPTSNHFINMLKDKDSDLYKSWYYVYNNYDDILEKCHNEITLKKISTILETEKYDVNRKLITPDNYLLNRNSFIENIVLGNKTHKPNNEVLNEIIRIYNLMKKRLESSIPYVKDKSTSGYTYETMKLDDPQIFELGYKANCCIRTFDIAHKHLLHAALCRNGRILIIYDKLGDAVAFVPLKRNGNVLIANSIECIEKNKGLTEISETFTEAILDIVNTSKQSNDPINLVGIGRNSYLKPKTTPFPDEYPTPTIYEKKDETYRYTDTYHKSLDIVYKDPNFKFENISSYDPKVSYQDPREEVQQLEFYKDIYNNEEVLKLINGINYTKDQDNYHPINKYIINTIYYSKDWYIIETAHELIGAFLDNDPRAKQEYDTYYEMLSKKERPKRLIK